MIDGSGFGISTAAMPTVISVASSRGEGGFYRHFGTATLNQSSSGAGSCAEGKEIGTVAGIMVGFTTGFFTAPPATGGSGAGSRFEGKEIGAVDVIMVKFATGFGTATLPACTSELSPRGERPADRSMTSHLPISYQSLTDARTGLRQGSLIDDYCCAGGGDHQHAVVCAEHFVVDVDADYGVSSHAAGALSHLFHGILSCLDQFVLIRSRPSADKVADAGGKVLEEVHSGDDLSEDDSFVFPDCVALDGRCG